MDASPYEVVEGEGWIVHLFRNGGDDLQVML